MPFKLLEVTENNSANMDEIWDSFWAKGKVAKQVAAIETDMFLQQYRSVFLKFLSKQHRILEGGCGLGQWVIYFNRNGYDITGIDCAAKTIDLIKQYDSGIPVEVGDIVQSRFANSWFDAYISLGVVEHFEDGPSPALREARRILKNKGILLISIPVFNMARQLVCPLEKIFQFFRENIYVRKILNKKEYPPKVFVEYKYTIRAFEDILKSEGFSVITKIPILESPNNLFNHFLSVPGFLVKGSPAYRLANVVSRMLERISTWIAPHMVIWVCENNGNKAYLQEQAAVI